VRTSLAAASATALLATILGAAIATTPAIAASSSTPRPKIIKAIQHDRSQPLRNLRGIQQSGRRLARTPVHQSPSTTTTPPPRASVVAGDPVLQATPPAAAGPPLAGSFEGIGAGIPGYNVTYAPSDVNGAIGPNDYFQIVNASVAVFSRTGTLLLGPEPISTAWSGFGGLCETTNGGDPIALYDRAADRWLISQLAYAGANGTSVPYLNCVAVSTSGDPTGSYFRYAFPRTELPDYSKFSVWPDAYYMTDNDQQNGNNFTGPSYAALDRTAMLAGGPAMMIVFSLGTNYASLLPAGQDGPTPPPAGSPGYALALGSDQASLDLWRLHADFTTPANATLTGPFAIPVAPFRELCGGFGSCVPQPSQGQPLASLGDRLMYRLAYRNFGDHDSLVVSHSVDPGQGGSNSGGVRWYEVRTPGGTPSLYQQGTFAPDSNYRWMGSVAMDARGDIAAGYSLSGVNLAPSIAITGRLAGDPLGSLPQGETIMVGGTGVQGFGLDRWGDYTSMAVDPVDDCTFWYTNQYIGASGTFNWHTRVGSFRYASCTLAPSSTTLTTSPNPSTGGLVTLTADVTGSGVTPTGSVTFQDGNSVLGSSALSGGQATLNVALLGGARSLAAVYSGDAAFSGSSSPLVVQQVNLPATTTTLLASTASATAASPVTLSASVSGSIGTPSGSVTFFDGSLDLGSAALASGVTALTTGELSIGAHSITASYSGDTANAASTSNAVSVTVSGPAYSVLYNFTGGTDGGAPINGVTQGPDGALYGVTNIGNGGTIFRFSPRTGLTTLHTFVDADGGRSLSRLLLGADGALYGTSARSSTISGSAWRITTQGAFSLLHAFNGADGQDPGGGLVQDSAGTLYGSTVSGGPSNCGTIFSITAAGAFATLYAFSCGADGNAPRGALVFGGDGNLYGVTNGGGSNDFGTVFRITTGGVLTSLYSFKDAADGVGPQSGLILGADGNLYGTASGGTMARGTIFRITSAGVLTTLYELSPGDGSGPSGLVQDAKGTLYGEATRTDPYPGGGYGTLFEFTSAATFVTLRAMDFHTGANPAGGMTIASDGNLYGTDSAGGTNGWGAIFSLSLVPPLTLAPATLSGLSEGASANLTVAQVSGGAPPYSASIDWGDGTTSAGTVSTGGSVNGSHTWAEESASPYTVTVTVTDSGGNTASVTDAATVGDAALSGSASTVQATEGAAFSGTVATFNDANSAPSAGDFTVTITWGDGSTSTGSITGTGPFAVSGVHTYSEGGSYPTSVTIKDAGGSALTVHGTAAISDFPLSLTGVSLNVSKNFSGTVAKLADADPSAAASEYTVTIDWGDGTASAGSVNGKRSPFTVVGTHAYTTAGTFTVTVSVHDFGGGTATTTSTLTVH